MAFVLKALKWIGKIFLGIGGLAYWIMFILVATRLIKIEPADAHLVWNGILRKKKQ